ALPISLDQLDDRLPRAPAIVALRVRHGLLRGTVREAEAERLDRGRHRVRGVHAGARTGPRDSGRLDLLELRVADLAGRMRAHRLEHRHDVTVLRPRLDRAAVDEYRRPIEPRHRHHAARHVLVAAADRTETAE